MLNRIINRLNYNDSIMSAHSNGNNFTPYPGYLDDIQSSQAAYLSDIIGATSNAIAVVNDEDSVEVVEVIGEVNFVHCRGDCVRNLMTEDATRFCEKCVCFVCKEPAADCKKWSTHCLAVYKKAAKIVREESSSLVVFDHDIQTTSTEADPAVVLLEEKTLENINENAKTDVQEDQPREVLDAATYSNGDDKVAALKSTFQEYLSLKPEQLKALCDAKGIDLKGHRGLQRDRFIVALVRHFAEAN